MANNKDRKIRIGITQGDTNGIGYEIILKTLSHSGMLELCQPVIYGSSKILTYHRKAIEMPAFQIHFTRDINNLRDNMPNLFEVCRDEVKIELGLPDKQAGKAAFDALEAAVKHLKEGKIDVLVTAPISKENIQSSEFQFPGHTEYLEASLGTGEKALMIMCAEQLKVALVTIHKPIAEVPKFITKESVLSTIMRFNSSLKRDFAIQGPRIAVLALNPHAGENGLLGKEEQEVIIPAIQEANDKKVLCFGPYAADGFFGNRLYDHFDGVIAMYHDQGLAPFKAIAMETGVNFTAGLPYVRTSPDHGTGYDIVGKGIAHEDSLRHAIYTAIDVFRNRMTYDENHSNPLRKQYFDHSKDNVVLDLTKDDSDDTDPILT